MPSKPQDYRKSFFAVLRNDEIDFRLLEKQKQRVMDILWEHDKPGVMVKLTKKQVNALDGIVSMLDHMQDTAAKVIGKKKVFGKKPKK